MDERKALAVSCRHLHFDGPRKPADQLAAAAAYCREHDLDYDVYGEGKVLAALEARVGDLLGFPAARFFPSGTMAQTIALRIWAERAGTNHVGMHPTSHLELHEAHSYAHLHQLRTTLVGPAATPLLAAHLDAVPERLAALLIELPIREAGGLLPTWTELEALKAAAAARNVPLHLDGARLWEAGAGYNRPLAEITAGFGSVYVSFYKGIGALSGAMLLGETDFIAEAKVWQRRQGGNLWSLLPNAVTASMQLDARLARMPQWLTHARAIAAAIRKVPGVAVLPDPPHTCLFHVFLDLSPDAAEAARDRVAKEHGIWLFPRCRAADRPNTARFELYVGAAAESVTATEAASAFAALFEG